MAKEKQKVVPMPGLYRRLLNQAMQSMDHDHYIEAETYFDKALQLDPRNPQAHLGLVVSQIETGKAVEAKEHCEQMLAEGIGEYEDILDPYLTTLIQLEEYELITDLIEAVLEDHSVPEELVERLYQVLDFCQYKLSESQKTPEDEAIFNEGDKHHLVPLQGDRSEDEDSSHSPLGLPQQDDLQKCLEFVRGKENDPYFKTMILQHLKDQNLKETVSVYKYGKTFGVDLATMADINTDALFVAVKQRLNDVLEQQNPSLHEMAEQLWKHYVFSVFPLEITPNDAAVWSGAVYQSVHTMNQMAISSEQTAAIYRISAADLQAAVESITTVEEEGTIH